MPTRTAAAVIGLVLTTILVTWSAADSSKERAYTARADVQSAPVKVAAVNATDLRSVLATWLRRRAAPGAVVGVKIGDRDPVFVVAGVEGRQSSVALTDTTAFRIGGVTTAFVGAVALQLSEQGRLDLDATVDRWLPGFPNAKRISVRDLLTHRSGIPPLGDESDAPGQYAAATKAFVAAHPRHAFTPQEIVEFVQRRPLLSKPGTAVHYSGVNPILVGIVVSAVTHTELGVLLHSQLLEPLALTDTYYAATEHRAPAVPGKALAPQTLTALGAADALVSTPHDLLGFSTAFFRARVRGTHDLATSVFRVGAGGTGLGVEGFSNHGFCALAGRGCPAGVRFFALGSEGSISGGSAAVVYDPVYDVSVVALANSAGADVSELARRALLLAKLGSAGAAPRFPPIYEATPTTGAGRLRLPSEP